jgi:hypothetical protein
MDNSFWVEFRQINIVANTGFHGSLHRPEGLIKNILNFFSDPPVPLYINYPPYLLFVENRYELIGRYWSFWDALKHENYQITAIIISEKDIEKVLEQDREEIHRFSHMKAKTPHRSTKRRWAIRAAGGICPFCRSYVRFYRDKSNELADRGGRYLHCDRNIIDKNSPNYEKLCDFRIKLTPYEYRLYTSEGIRIDEMMKAVEGKRCRNGRQLFMRTLRWGDKIDVDERCRDYFSVFPKCSCKHYKKIIENKPGHPEKNERNSTEMKR